MKNTTQDSRLAAALDILRGKTVVAHDRRKGDAQAIDFTQYRRTGLRVLRPSYGISNAMMTQLSNLADRVVFEGKKSGMPSFHFLLS